MIRVAHLPGRTPYARKLRDDDIRIVNETRLPPGDLIPLDLSFGWLENRPDFDFFDVLHVHSLELATEDVIEAVLDRCVAARKRVVMTIHDVTAMFEPQERYERKLSRAAARGFPMVTLTDGAACRLTQLAGGRRPVVLPHGYVIPPEHPLLTDPPRNQQDTARPGLVYAMCGGFRPNRLMYPVCVNAVFGLPTHDRIRILTRALSPVELQPGSDADKVTLLAAHAPHRVDLMMQPFPSDDEMAAFLAAADVLVMPYLWGSHSGQLEAAFDLGLVPVLPDTGYFREQWAQHSSMVAEPVWFDWPDDAPYSWGPRLLGAMLQARDTVEPRGHLTPSASFREHRCSEHARILTGYKDQYGI